MHYFPYGVMELDVTTRKSSKSFICEECVFIFTIYASLRVRKPYCPNCGDNFEVHIHNADRHSPEGRHVKIRWTETELDLLDSIIAGELLPSQVAMMTGRPTNAVVKRLGRRRRELK